MVVMTMDTRQDPAIEGKTEDQTANETGLQDSDVEDQKTEPVNNEPSWFDDAIKFYANKKTALTPDDELGKEMWKSIQNANKLQDEIKTYKQQVEEAGAYKTDLEWIMQQPELAKIVIAKIKGQPLPEQGEELTPEQQERMQLVQRIQQLEHYTQAGVESSINSRFENHLKELQGKYPSMDAEMVRRIAKAERVIYDPKAPEKVEELAKLSHERIESLRQKHSDETIQSLRNKSRKNISTGGGSTNTQTNSTDFKAIFEEEWGKSGMS